ncbi:helix-turn-helix domain-containing protein [Paenibacillus sp. OV219]|uniref:helix-turn-helix domain-containing protein n=1 Tax=Paenibacillus sp. OV219 TaxID=1884377 RepID=UPI0008CD3115|nr:helix-turn-helix transcriptional regulator [Paenibacillus sp. OV219]SEO72688.1 Helix-turn-helix [Paenibacillus sp. OV219]
MFNINASVGKKIRLYRKAMNLTQDELGEILHIDQSYLGRIERGEINVTLETLWKISDALQINPSQLLETSSRSSDKVRADTLAHRQHTAIR